jgi:MYXO-CTERM domain-containing protein
MNVRVFTLTLIAAIAPAAIAGDSVQGRGFEWVEIDNGGVSDASGADLTGYRTFDLYFNIGAQDALVTGVNMGYAPNPAIDDPPPFLETDGLVFNHLFGSDLQSNAGLVAAFPALEFDTFVTFGGVDTLVVPNSVDLTGNNSGQLRGVWTVPGGVMLTAGEQLWALRITVTDFTYLRGTIQMGLGATVPYFDVPNVPSPGATGLLAVTGFALTRRRR